MRPPRPASLAAVLALAAAFVGTVGPPAMAATTRYVSTSGVDSGTCASPTSPCRTITYALGQSASGDTISIAAGTYDEDLLIGNSVTLNGAGEGSTTIDGGGLFSTVQIISGSATVAISNLTITGGSAQYGGGINTNAPTLTLTRVAVTGNKATPPSTIGGAAPAAGGGIYSTSTGTLTLDHSKIMGNTAQGEAGKKGATGSGAPGGNGGSAYGGGVYGVGTTVVATSTTISSNKAMGGRGGAGGSYVNSSPGTGGDGGDGGTAQGGGVYNDGGTLSFTTSTISKNTAQSGGGGKGGDATPGVGGDGGGADSFFDASYAQSAGGGIYNGGTHSFGHQSNVTLTGTQLSSNKVLDGTAGSGGSGSTAGGSGSVWTTCGRGEGGGIEDAFGATVSNLTITGSTIDGNTSKACSGGAGGKGAAGQQGQNGGAGGDGGGGNPTWGGGIFFYGLSGGSVSITGTSLENNAGQGGAGGKGGDGGAGGPVVSGPGRGGGAGGDGGTGQAAHGGALTLGGTLTSLTITGDLFSANSATAGTAGDGGAGGKGGAGGTGAPGGNGGPGGRGGLSIDADGAAIQFLASPSAPIANSTFVGNGATGGRGGDGAAGGDGGGGTPSGLTGSTGSGGNAGDGEGGALWTEYPVSLTNDTITGNSATGGVFGTGNPAGSPGDGLGGGIYWGTYTLANTLVADNTATGGIDPLGPDCDSSTASEVTAGHNIIGDGTGCSGSITNGDLQGDEVGNSGAPIDPMLGGSLCECGGPTETLAPKPGSPLIGDGGAAACLAAPVSDVDQRGFPRESGKRGTCDVGAYDTALPETFRLAAPSQVVAGQAFDVTVTAVDAFANTVPGYVGKVGFTSSDPGATLPKAYTFKAGDAGVHTFSLTLATAGTQTITVKDKSVKLLAATITISVSS